jgi:hypothetical protein
VAALYLEAELDLIVDLWLSPKDLLPERTIWLLSKYIVEYKIYCFTVAANTKHSTAPSTVLLEARCKQFVPADLPSNVKAQLIHLLLDRGGRRKQWLFTMRRRWSIVLGRLNRVSGLKTTQLLERALVFYQTMNCAVASAPAEKPCLVVNIDETSISYGYYGQKGFVVRKNKCPFDIPEPHEVEVKSCLRGSMTLVSSIASDAAYQKRLPQFLIANKHKLSNRDFEQLDVPPPFHVWRQDSAWNSGPCMRRILTLLQQAVPDVTLIVVLDVASVHLDKSVLTHAKKLKIVLVFVPALCTWVLQPLDVFVFALLKALLRLLFQNAMVETSGPNAVSTVDLIKIVVQATQQIVMNKSWDRAFLSCGVCGQHSLGASTLKKLGISSIQPLGNQTPSIGAIASILPSNRHQLAGTIRGFYSPSFYDCGREAQEANSAVLSSAPAPASLDLPSRKPELLNRLVANISLAFWQLHARCFYCN